MKLKDLQEFKILTDEQKENFEQCIKDWVDDLDLGLAFVDKERDKNVGREWFIFKFCDRIFKWVGTWDSWGGGEMTPLGDAFEVEEKEKIVKFWDEK